MSTPEDQADRILKAALHYATEGFRVIPLRPGLKVPVQTDWPKQATKDTRTIYEWFGMGGEFVGCNLGIATGRESDLWVLDVDLGHGAEAGVSIAKLIAENGTIGETRRVKTPSGGLHYWFTWPALPADDDGNDATWRNINATAATALGAGIDVRAEGGQVAVWPSILRDGTAYEEGTGPLLPVPEWLAVKTRYQEKVVRGERVKRVDLDPATQDRAGRYALQAISGVVDDLKEMSDKATPNGHGYDGAPWNATCFAKACRLLEIANADWSPVTTDEAFAIFFDSAPRDDDFTDETVAVIWRSAERTVGEKEATLPPPTLDIQPDGTLFGQGFATVNPAITASTPPTVDPNVGLPLLGGRTGTTPLFLNIALRINQADLALGKDHDIWVYEGGVFKREPDLIEKRASRLLGNAWNHNWLASVKAQVVHNIGLVGLGDGASRLDLINTRSGMLDWSTETLLPHDPEYRSTIQLPVEWDPTATSPKFDAWLAQVAPGEVGERVLQVMGYLMQPGNDMQKAVLLLGSGGNGKGTLIRVIREMIGGWNTSSVSLHSMAENTYGVADLYGKQANLAGDIEAKYLRDTAAFKALTGGDSVEVRRIYKDPFDFTCQATPLFSANEVWRSGDTTEGYRRRWVIVPMSVDVTKLAPLREADLLAERNGIFVQAIRALQRLRKAGAFTESFETTAAREDFDTASDVVKMWLLDDDVITFNDPATTDRTKWTYRSTLYKRFSVWARDNGHLSPPAASKFFRHLESIGFIAQTRSGPSSAGGGRGFVGLTVNATADGQERITFAA